MSKEYFEFGGLANSFDETKTAKDSAWAMQNCTVLKGVLESSARYSIFGSHDGAGGSSSDVGYGMGYGQYSSNEKQRLQLSYATAPTSGSIKLVFDGQTTGTIAYNATATDVLTALEALSNISLGDVKVTGGPWPTALIDVELTGQYANTDVALMTTTDNTLNNSATLTPSEYVKGGDVEIYLAAVKLDGDSTVTMFKVDCSTGTFTSVATGLTASDWYFQQYGNQIFAVNATDGFHYYRIGGNWDDGQSGTRPKAPVVAPTFAYTLTGSAIAFNSGFASITQSGLSGATVTGTASGISIVYTGSTLTTQTQVVVTATYSVAQDFQFNDVWRPIVLSGIQTDANLTQGSLKFQLTNSDGSPVTLNPFAECDPLRDTNIQLIRYFHYANQSRTSRDNILKFVFTFTVDSWTQNKQVTITLWKGLSWMASRVPFVFEVSGSTPVPDKSSIRYAYSYFNATTGIESDLSPDAQTQQIPSNWEGANVTLTLRGSSDLSTSDRIYVYRQQKATGEWRRLPTDSNNLGTYGSANVASGTTTFVDKWMEEELKDFPLRTAPAFSNARSTLEGLSIGDWKQCLVVGSSRKAWLSFVGIPMRFAPDPDNREEVIDFNAQNKDNPDVGRTTYIADNRSEGVVLVIGQDSLYLVGPQSSYAIVGDTPLESSPPRRLPGSRGAVGKRAGYRYKGGVHVGSEDGLWFLAVGRGFSGEDNGALVANEETEGVRRSWQTTLLGSSYSGLVIIEHENEIWAFNGTKYLRNNRSRRWEEGTFTDSVVAAVAVRSLGLRFMDSNGRIHTIDDAYTTDNGTTVNWSYETGILEGPNVRVTGLEVQSVGTPTVTVRVYTPFGDHQDDYGKYESKSFDIPANGTIDLSPIVLDSGFRHKFLFSGVCGRDKITSFAPTFEGMGKAYGGRK